MFIKERKEPHCAADMSANEERNIALLVGTKAMNLRIPPSKAGKLAALLCEDFHAARAQLLEDMINNPNILKAARMVMEGKGLEDYEDEDAGEPSEETE